MESAIILNGKCVSKVSNFTRKKDKYIGNPNIKILEVCDKSVLNNRFNYWKEQYKQPIDELDDSVTKYYFKNTKTGETIVSIYDNLNNLKGRININDYERYV